MDADLTRFRDIHVRVYEEKKLPPVKTEKGFLNLGLTVSPFVWKGKLCVEYRPDKTKCYKWNKDKEELEKTK